MFKSRRIVVVGHATSLFLLLSYILCIGFGLILPNFQMHEAWAPLLPGFEWLTPSGFFLGLLGSYVYGWFIAVLWVPLYEFFDRRDTARQ